VIFGSSTRSGTLFWARTLVLCVHEVICLQSGFGFSLLFRSGEKPPNQKLILTPPGLVSREFKVSFSIHHSDMLSLVLL
jgi:hypothetical protein